MNQSIEAATPDDDNQMRKRVLSWRFHMIFAGLLYFMFFFFMLMASMEKQQGPHERELFVVSNCLFNGAIFVAAMLQSMLTRWSKFGLGGVLAALAGMALVIAGMATIWSAYAPVVASLPLDSVKMDLMLGVAAAIVAIVLIRTMIYLTFAPQKAQA